MDQQGAGPQEEDQVRITIAPPAEPGETRRVRAPSGAGKKRRAAAAEEEGETPLVPTPRRRRASASPQGAGDSPAPRSARGRRGSLSTTAGQGPAQEETLPSSVNSQLGEGATSSGKEPPPPPVGLVPPGEAGGPGLPPDFDETVALLASASLNLGAQPQLGMELPSEGIAALQALAQGGQAKDVMEPPPPLADPPPSGVGDPGAPLVVDAVVMEPQALALRSQGQADLVPPPEPPSGTAPTGATGEGGASLGPPEGGLNPALVQATELVDSSKGAFRFSARNVFLTYPRCLLTKDTLVMGLKGFIDKKGLKISFLCVAQESHKDGTPHFHVMVCFADNKKFDTRNPRVFDIEGYHPNIRSVRSLQAVRDYLLKEDPSPYVEGELPASRASFGASYDLMLQRLARYGLNKRTLAAFPHMFFHLQRILIGLQLAQHLPPEPDGSGGDNPAEDPQASAISVEEMEKLIKQASGLPSATPMGKNTYLFVRDGEARLLQERSIPPDLIDAVGASSSLDDEDHEED